MSIEAKVAPSIGVERNITFMDKVHARLSAMRAQATGFVSQPEPRTIGSFAKGKQLAAGNFQFGGHLVQAEGRSLWEITPPDAMYEAELNGFTWLDDLASVGNRDSRLLAQAWVHEWIERFGRGRGLGWSPDLTGRRLIRWINHALFLMNGQTPEANDRYYKSLAHQTAYLGRRWSVASRGLPRFEALTGLLYASLSLGGMERYATPSTNALARECADQIDAEGGIPTRNPEELLEVFTLLTWAAAALTEAGRTPLPAHLAAIERMAPTLRALRHADGGLARFHGGGRGLDGRLDHALAYSGVKAAQLDGLAMGYARLSGGRTTVIADVSAPPARNASRVAHASTLAFELTSGRRALIVNCGSGAPFGAEWRRAGRATPSHSTLSIDGVSSAKLIAEPQGEFLTSGPTKVTEQRNVGSDATEIIASHNSYCVEYGLTHVRKMEVSLDGRRVTGEDTLAALSDPDRVRFEAHMDKISLQGVPYSVRFHLHPEVDASLDMGGTAISLALKSGEVWVFRPSFAAKMTIEPSVYLEKGRLKPRASKQIVLSSRVMEYASQVSWSLAKAQDTPSYLRDVDEDLELALN
ncbi:putative heparinase superfamily protein [Litoreibacter halocynthiae]|uniref:Putative heparinase superfamily protein n=1 Tax=Litoreibacter halocynthiae TaxID=1242689 RepID=A0A4R7LGB8_9RHOB|nr:heparinase II/III family protein [Litoreibacter halocynthiae]TDT73000.1 putative heparinase superfamily protein [Litoreibacter halocynthiae]